MSLPVVSKQAKLAFSKNSVLIWCLALLFPLIVMAQNEGDMRFPDGAQTSMTALDPKCQSNTTGVFCVDVENYPAAHLESLLKKDLKRYVEMFSVDLQVKIATRFDTPGGDPLCDSRERVIFPKSGIDQDGKKRFLYNTNEHKQGIKVEECINVDKGCSKNARFPANLKALCEQKYIFRPLLALSTDGSKLVKDQFQFPSSCKCIMKSLDP